MTAAGAGSGHMGSTGVQAHENGRRCLLGTNPGKEVWGRRASSRLIRLIRISIHWGR